MLNLCPKWEMFHVKFKILNTKCKYCKMKSECKMRSSILGEYHNKTILTGAIRVLEKFPHTFRLITLHLSEIASQGRRVVITILL